MVTCLLFAMTIAMVNCGGLAFDETCKWSFLSKYSVCVVCVGVRVWYVCVGV